VNIHLIYLINKNKWLSWTPVSILSKIRETGISINTNNSLLKSQRCTKLDDDNDDYNDDNYDCDDDEEVNDDDDEKNIIIIIIIIMSFWILVTTVWTLMQTV
jgi:hypothetical protein